MGYIVNNIFMDYGYKSSLIVFLRYLLQNMVTGFLVMMMVVCVFFITHFAGALTLCCFS